MSVFPEFSFPFNDLHDADFNLTIYEMQNGPIRYDADILASLSFNPLFPNIRTNLARSLTLILIPTLATYFAMSAYEYFIESQFNDMLSSEDSGIFVTDFLYCV